MRFFGKLALEVCSGLVIVGKDVPVVKNVHSSPSEHGGEGRTIVDGAKLAY